MKNKLRWFLIVLTALLITIQFFQPNKNYLPETTNHIFNQVNTPDNIKLILKTSCLDCHSNQTNYQWYHKISPVSWLVNKHIIEGKKELNFSDWGLLSSNDKISILSEICDEIEKKNMPLKSYTSIHRSARLSEQQITLVCEWAEKTGMEIMNENQ